MFLRYTVDIAAALLALRCAGRVLTGRDGVENPRFGSMTYLWIPKRKEGVHFRRYETLLIHLNPYASYTEWNSSLNEGRVRIFFRHYAFASRGEHS